MVTFLDAILDKTLRSTVALLSGRGRGESTALGLAIVGTVAAGYSKFYITVPSPKNLKTLLDFVCKGFTMLLYKEHLDYDIVKSSNPKFKKSTVRINISKHQRQTIQISCISLLASVFSEGCQYSSNTMVYVLVLLSVNLEYLACILHSPNISMSWRRELEFEVNDRVFLKFSPMKGVIHFERKSKLSPYYIGPYLIVKRISGVAYELDFPASLASIHPVFHMSMLKKCLGDHSLVFPVEEVKVKDS
ncbi:hypothetical protein T459_22851 [Capsicum annuum]|uniref:Uncharacterized protein n=1 Tax=Capsicum annuum TaxID=4072 RepID=A0A2G2YQP1_CAPAN|nr:hypothetical protein T459_22851 [Capsicum annuum]